MLMIAPAPCLVTLYVYPYHEAHYSKVALNLCVHVVIGDPLVYVLVQVQYEYRTVVGVM